MVPGPTATLSRLCSPVGNQLLKESAPPFPGPQRIGHREKLGLPFQRPPLVPGGYSDRSPQGIDGPTRVESSRRSKLGPGPGEIVQGFHGPRETLGHQGKHLESKEVSGETRVGVRTVVVVHDVFARRHFGEERSPKPQEGTAKRPSLVGHPGQALPGPPLQQAHQHRLRLVVCVVGQENRACRVFRKEGLETRVSMLPGGVFIDGNRNRRRKRSQGHPQPMAPSSDRLCLFGPLLLSPPPMVDVESHQGRRLDTLGQGP